MRADEAVGGKPVIRKRNRNMGWKNLHKGWIPPGEFVFIRTGSIFEWNMFKGFIASDYLHRWVVCANVIPQGATDNNRFLIGCFHSHPDHSFCSRRLSMTREQDFPRIGFEYQLILKHVLEHAA